MLLLRGLCFELSDSLPEVGWAVHGRVFLELGVDGKNVGEAMDSIVLEGLLA